LLNKTLQNSVWHDGDWGGMINPWTVNDEDMRMVEDLEYDLTKITLTCSEEELKRRLG